MFTDLLRMLCGMTSSETAMLGVALCCIDSFGFRGSSGFAEHSEQRKFSSYVPMSGGRGFSLGICRMTLLIEVVSGCFRAR